MKRTLTRQIYPAFLIIEALAVIILIAFTSGTFTGFEYDQTQRHLRENVNMLASAIDWDSVIGNDENADRLAKSIASTQASRVTIILPSGRVIGDSEQDPAEMDNHLLRPEIQDALHFGTGMSTRFSVTLVTNLMYVARTVQNPGGETIAILRTAFPVDDISETLGRVYGPLVAVGLFILLLTTIASILLSRKIAEPLRLMESAARRYADGDLDFRFYIDKPEEISTLAATMNGMASQLKNRIATIVQQKNERDAMLESMVEGVIRLDTKLRVKSLNTAAAAWATVEGPAEGLGLLEVIPNSELLVIAEEALSTGNPSEKSITLAGTPDPIHIQVHGNRIRGENGRAEGVILVMNNITKLKKLEEIRTDFVANVSHELKTPITLIKGFIETLQSGALDDRERAHHFMGIIAHHTERINALIDDLLSLSRLEQNGTDLLVDTEPVPVGELIAESVSICLPKAEAKHIRIVSPEGPEDDIAINRVLCEEALINLIDNAVKYAPENTTVTISRKAEDGMMALSVADQGPGIPLREQSRVFERFYRVDKARSRTLGGTGLGLSIVKHIALAHGGSVRLKSSETAGSVFTITLPLARDDE